MGFGRRVFIFDNDGMSPVYKGKKWLKSCSINFDEIAVVV